MINNTRPAFLSNGTLNTAARSTRAPRRRPRSLRTYRRRAERAPAVSWAYYGGGYNAARRFDNGSTDPVDVLIGTGGDWYCDICNSFQYAKSIMGDPAQRHAHIKDALDFFDDVDHGRLPAVAYIKPDSFLMGIRRAQSAIFSRRYVELRRQPVEPTRALRGDGLLRHVR